MDSSVLYSHPVTLTPAHLPPHPSSIHTLYSDRNFRKILEKLTGKSCTSMAGTAYTSKCEPSRPFQTPQSSNDLELNYQHPTRALSAPQRVKDTISQNPPVFFNRGPANTNVVGRQQPANTAVEQTLISANVCLQGKLKPANVSLGKHHTVSSIHTGQRQGIPFNSTSKESNLTSSALKRTMKQTKIVPDKSTGKLVLSKQATCAPPNLSLKTSEPFASSGTQSPLKDVRHMSTEELAMLEGHLSGVEEVAACLVYNDGSSQLQANMGKNKTGRSQSVQASGLCVAYPVKSPSSRAPRLHYVLIPLVGTGETLHSWCRHQVCTILSRARVISYGGQQLAANVISGFDLLGHPNEWLQWTLLDIQVGVWLLDPDHPPESFAHALNQCGMQSPADKGSESVAQLCAGMSQLGPGMVKIFQKLQKENLWLLFEKIEVKLIPILAAMDVAGVQVNSAKLLQYAEFLKVKISKVEQLAHKAVGHQFSINSTAQLRQILFEELQLDDLCGRKLSKTTVCKLQSTSEAVLTQLVGLHPLPQLVLQYRQLCKINATYITGVLPYIFEDVLKPTWQHTGAATGRLVSSNPNIQAFPKQSINLGVVKESFVIGKEPEEVTIDIRETVESRPGYTFIDADFRSIELRLVAHFSEDSLLLSILNSKKTPDVFIHLTSEWLGVEVDKVTPAHRERTKRVVYAVVYGVGNDRLAEMLNVEPSYARDLTTSFLNIFAGVKNFITKTIEECRNKGYLVSICGRRRWFPHIKSSNSQLRLHTERQAVNFVVQGSAADICKCGMLEVCTLLAREHPNSRLLVQIHDEMIFEVPDEEIKEVADLLKRCLESLTLLGNKLKVPLEVRLTTGKNWSSLTDFQTTSAVTTSCISACNKQ